MGGRRALRRRGTGWLGADPPLALPDWREEARELIDVTDLEVLRGIAGFDVAIVGVHTASSNRPICSTSPALYWSQSLGDPQAVDPVCGALAVLRGPGFDPGLAPCTPPATDSSLMENWRG